MMPPQKVGHQVRIISYYSPEAFAKLKRLSEDTRIPQSVYLREALDDLLSKYSATSPSAGGQKKKRAKSSKPGE